MSVNKEKDNDDFLNKWSDVKEQINVLEKKLDNYKKYASKRMLEMNTNSLVGTEYVLTKAEVTKTTIGKDDLPEDIWRRYSKKCTFDTYRLTKQKEPKEKKMKK
jgi:hypothetical protein